MGYIYCCLNDEGEEKVHKTLKCFFSLKAMVGKLFLHAPVMYFSLPSRLSRLLKHPGQLPVLLMQHLVECDLISDCLMFRFN